VEGADVVVGAGRLERDRDAVTALDLLILLAVDLDPCG
jgi:hypothetical protein